MHSEAVSDHLEIFPFEIKAQKLLDFVESWLSEIPEAFFVHDYHVGFLRNSCPKLFTISIYWEKIPTINQYTSSKPNYYRIGLSVSVIFNEISQCYLKKKSLVRLRT